MCAKGLPYQAGSQHGCQPKEETHIHTDVLHYTLTGWKPARLPAQGHTPGNGRRSFFLSFCVCQPTLQHADRRARGYSHRRVRPRGRETGVLWHSGAPTGVAGARPAARLPARPALSPDPSVPCDPHPNTGLPAEHIRCHLRLGRRGPAGLAGFCAFTGCVLSCGRRHKPLIQPHQLPVWPRYWMILDVERLPPALPSSLNAYGQTLWPRTPKTCQRAI